MKHNCESYIKGNQAGLVLLLLVFVLMFDAAAGLAQQISVRAVAEKSTVYIGESFTFQIQVEGDDNPEISDLSGIEDFNVQDQGGSKNNSSSITIINGRMMENIVRRYIFTYILTPKKLGRLTIPSVAVKAGGQNFRTEPINIKVEKPSESRDFKLRMKLSSSEVYVGEPVTLIITWYISKDVESFSFNLPIAEDPRFQVDALNPSNLSGSSDNLIRIPVLSEEVIARKGSGVIDGKHFTTISFKKILIPKKSGQITLPQATVACEAIAGYQQNQKLRHPFDGFFDDDFFGDDLFFGRRRRAVLKKYVVPSNQPVLTVVDLPQKGRPKNFNGLVGDYSILASAKPTEVSVGDPITLTIQITGNEYLKNAELPALKLQKDLSKNFKIPAERAKGKVERLVKTFTQTIRARHENVTEIPPIELPFFDVKAKQYSVARSKPIPLKVSTARIVTALDAEGRAVSVVPGKELETWTQGIAHNYENFSVLKSQSSAFSNQFNLRNLLFLLILPPVLYLVLLIGVLWHRNRNSDPAALRSRRAWGEFVKALNKLKGQTDSDHLPGLVLEAVREYIGSKLHQTSGALTFRDVEDGLKERGAADDIINNLRKLFQECEASRYAGGSVDGFDQTEFIDRTLNLIKDLERRLK
jgi:hypothetical protein